MRTRVLTARERQRLRYAHTSSSHQAGARSGPLASGGTGGITNADAPVRLVAPAARLDPDARAMLVRAADKLMLSARGYHRVLRVARTIADLDDVDAVLREHVGEALRYRPVSAEQLVSPSVT